jgi:hypothetical protein
MMNGSGESGERNIDKKIWSERSREEDLTKIRKDCERDCEEDRVRERVRGEVEQRLHHERVTEEGDERGEGEDVSQRRGVGVIFQLDIGRNSSGGRDGVEEEKKNWTEKRQEEPILGKE